MRERNKRKEDGSNNAKSDEKGVQRVHEMDSGKAEREV